LQNLVDHAASLAILLSE
ncbi:hypothetical protein D046_2799B, partial [Vibrio parahaemolyticus V-223/04]